MDRGPRSWPEHLAGYLYGLLVRALPRPFRDAHGHEMEQAFRSSLRDACERSGARGLLSTCVGAALDLARTNVFVRSDLRAARRGRDTRAAGRLEIPSISLLFVDLSRDVRLALRGLMRAPVFSGAVVLTLGVGIGANTATFQVVNETIRKPLPYPDSDQLVYLTNEAPSMGTVGGKVSAREAWDWQANISALQEVAVLDPELFSLAGDDSGEAEAVRGARTSHNLLSVLGVEPTLGRSFVSEDDQPGAAGVVLLSHGLWIRRYGADPTLLGRAVSIGGRPHVVIGVLPAGFTDPIGGGLGEPPGLYTPLALNPLADNVASRWLFGIARVREGVSIAAAQDEIDSHRSALIESDPDLYPPEMHVGVVSLHDATYEALRAPLGLALAGAIFVLLIVCANLAALLLARGSVRAREVAILTAMGASRYRVLRQVLVESLVLASVGAVTGLLVAGGLGAYIEREAAAEAARLATLSFDLDVFVFVGGVSVLCAVAFGLLPAISLSKADPQLVLKEGQGLGGGTGKRFTQKLLVVSQMSVALVLMVGALMVFKSFAALAAIDTGFDREQVVTFELQLPSSRYAGADAQIAFHVDLARSLLAIPGVETVGAVNKRPLGTRWGCNAFLPRGWAVPASNPEWPCAEDRSATPGYFAAMGIELLRGRTFGDSDSADDPRVVIVSEAFARQIWPGEEAVGRQLQWAREFGTGAEWREVVGVVGDVTHIGLDRVPTPAIYGAFAQSTDRRMTLAVRSSVDPLTLLPAVRAEVGRLDSTLPLRDVRTMDAIVESRLDGPLTAVLFFAILASAGLLLSLSGVYALMSGSVTSQFREIGLKVALGADASAVVRGFVVQGLRMGLIAAAFGVVGGMLVGQVISSLLFGVGPLDPVSLSLGAVALVLVATLAAYVPARRAARVDPMAALRHD